METNYEPKKIENILSEADELLNQLNSELIQEMEETQRTQIEIHANTLKKRKLEVQHKIKEDKTSDPSSYGEGMHEAIDEIVTAMKALTRYLT
ncbi:MAG: hypothetical protein RBR67_15670 [Desulfobacterium sp.]|jgi:hypothetical protein|nr:hypothetical protein [Desulfobacterium sp.]